jgi:hypothetical protein
MDLRTLIERMRSDRVFIDVALNPRAQFGLPNRRYLGATLLPERLVPENAYEETEIRYRTVLANDGSRYSPAQKKGDQSLVGSFLVVLGNQDIAREFTGSDYDGLIRLLSRGGTNATMQAMATITRWTDTAVNLGLAELNEKHRWDALINAKVLRRGDNGYAEDVPLSDPPGHRVVAAGVWSNPAYDPYVDITAGVQKLRDKGYDVNRFVTSTRVLNILAANPKIQQRTGSMLVFNANGSVSTFQTSASLSSINARLQADGYPAIELYDLKYFTQVGTARFMPEDVFFMAATTGRTEEIPIGQETIVMENTLGYFAIGRAVGEAAPGRVIREWPFDNKPPRIEAEGWQTGFPVPTDPEAMFVIKSIA